MDMKVVLLSSLMLISVCSVAKGAEGLEKPTEKEATQAIGNMFGLPADIIQHTKVRIGQCIIVEHAEHKGQIACTVAVEVGASTSETQVDFFRDPQQMTHWVAQPSESQEHLLFPDPSLQ